MKFLDSVAVRFRAFCIAFFAFSIVLIEPDALMAQTTASDVAGNMTTSAESLPGLVSAFAYFLGLLFAVRGIFKLKAHVESPGEGGGQTPLRTPMISFLAGGAMFGLPMIYEAAQRTFGEGVLAEFTGSTGGVATKTEAIAGKGSTTNAGFNFNALLDNFAESIASLPGLITAFAYLLGTVIIVLGIIKAKEHIENPEQTKLQESVIRILTGGALFAIPAIFTAMAVTISGGEANIDGSTDSLLNTDLFKSSYILAAGTGFCNEGPTFGAMLCDSIGHYNIIPTFLTALSYLFGLVMGVWGVLKIRDHSLNPQQTSIFEGLSRLVAGGAFFALPVTVDVFKNAISNGNPNLGDSSITKAYNLEGDALAAADQIVGGNACPVEANGLGLDGIFACFATDILGPMHIVLNFFAFVAGMVFIMIGISRLIKGSQEGARAPGGLGTIMSFVIGGALISYNDIMRAATNTFTGNATTHVFAEMQYVKGMSAPELEAAHAVISSILKFMIVVGLISFVRGLFIVRSVAEGNQQASMMAAVTHIVGGALAVNLGPLLNAVQATLGVQKFGIAFS